MRIERRCGSLRERLSRRPQRLLVVSLSLVYRIEVLLGLLSGSVATQRVQVVPLVRRRVNWLGLLVGDEVIELVQAVLQGLVLQVNCSCGLLPGRKRGRLTEEFLLVRGSAFADGPLRHSGLLKLRLVATPEATVARIVRVSLCDYIVFVQCRHEIHGSIVVLRVAHLGAHRGTHGHGWSVAVLNGPDLFEVLHELKLIQARLRVSDLLVALRARSLVLVPLFVLKAVVVVLLVRIRDVVSSFVLVLALVKTC